MDKVSKVLDATVKEPFGEVEEFVKHPASHDDRVIDNIVREGEDGTLAEKHPKEVKELEADGVIKDKAALKGKHGNGHNSLLPHHHNNSETVEKSSKK